MKIKHLPTTNRIGKIVHEKNIQDMECYIDRSDGIVWMRKGDDLYARRKHWDEFRSWHIGFFSTPRAYNSPSFSIGCEIVRHDYNP